MSALTAAVFIRGAFSSVSGACLASTYATFALAAFIAASAAFAFSTAFFTPSSATFILFGSPVRRAAAPR